MSNHVGLFPLPGFGHRSPDHDRDKGHLPDRQLPQRVANFADRLSTSCDRKHPTNLDKCVNCPIICYYRLVLFGRIFVDLLGRVARNTPDTKGRKMGK
eukprot:s1408_g12.t1